MDCAGRVLAARGFNHTEAQPGKDEEVLYVVEAKFHRR
jgi:hypothetical protein